MIYELFLIADKVDEMEILDIRVGGARGVGFRTNLRDEVVWSICVEHVRPIRSPLGPSSYPWRIFKSITTFCELKGRQTFG